MKSTVKKLISAMLILSLAIGILAVPVFAANEENKTYYFIGDSMSYNFVKKNNYLAADYMKTYPELAAEYFGYTVTEDCRLPGGRVTDAYAMMSDYIGDDYYDEEFSARHKPEYAAKIAEADVLSVQMGYSGLSILVRANLASIIEGDELEYNVDLSQIFTDSELEKIAPYISKCRELVSTLFDSETVEALSQLINQLTDAQSEKLNELFGDGILGTLSDVGTAIKNLEDTIVYYFVSHCIHFDRMVEHIYSVNPDVELYVMGMMNPVEQLSATIDMPCGKLTIPFGKIVGKIFGVLNDYMKIYSPMSDKYYYIDNLSHVETFGEVMAHDEALTLDILYANYTEDEKDGGWDDHQYKYTDAYNKAKAQAKGVSQAIANTQSIDLSRLVSELISGEAELSLDIDESALERLTEFDESGSVKATYFDQLKAHIYMFTILLGIYLHPTASGHAAEAPLLIEAMEKKQVEPLAIIYHKITAPYAFIRNKLNQSTLINNMISTVNSYKTAKNNVKNYLVENCIIASKINQIKSRLLNISDLKI